MRLGLLTTPADPRVVSAVGALIQWAPSSLPPVTIAGVGLERPVTGLGGELLAGAERASVPCAVFDAARAREEDPDGWRAQHEGRVAGWLDGIDAEVVLLCGYPWLVRHELLRRRLVNVHCAVPGGPAGLESAVIAELARTGATVTGLTAHVVTEVLDRGPALAYTQVPIVAAPRGTWPSRRVWSRRVAEVHGSLLPDFVVQTVALVAASDWRTWPPVGREWPVALPPGGAPGSDLG